MAEWGTSPSKNYFTPSLLAKWMTPVSRSSWVIGLKIATEVPEKFLLETAQHNFTSQKTKS
jgi:hypothetical protein